MIGVRNFSAAPVAAATAIHVVDDDDAVREATALMIGAAGYTAIGHSSGRQFLDSADLLSSGCVVLDLRMPGASGLEVLETMRARGSRLSVIMVTGHGDVRTAVRAMKNGAIDFIEKPYEQDVLIGTIDRALRASAGPDDIAAEIAKTKIRRLTPRECQVLHALMQGKVNKVIAADLGLSPRTVEMHRAHMMDRLGATSLSEALRIAFQAGLSLVADEKGAACP